MKASVWRGRETWARRALAGIVLVVAGCSQDDQTPGYSYLSTEDITVNVCATDGRQVIVEGEFVPSKAGGYHVVAFYDDQDPDTFITGDAWLQAPGKGWPTKFSVTMSGSGRIKSGGSCNVSVSVGD